MTDALIRGVRNRGVVRTAPRFCLRCLLPGFFQAVVLVSGLATSGCYSYSVIEPAQASSGLQVRARVSATESARIEEMTGVRDRVIQGQVVAVDSAALVLSIPTVLSHPGMSTGRLHQRVALANSAIVELESRQLSRPRTFSLIGAVAALAAYVVLTQFEGDDGDPGTDKPDPDAFVLKLRNGFD